jgi:hypothetical protein
MKTSLATLSAACCALALGLTAHGDTRVSVDLGLRVGPPAPIVVHRAPPRHVVERIPVSAGPGLVWVAGHYTWRNTEWFWMPGAWVRPPQPAAVWVESRFDERSQSWVDGYWSVPAAQPQVVEVIGAPPPLRHEARSHRPSRDHVWVDGYWIWRDHHHEWVPGRWDLPPRHNARWVAPRWEHRGPNYVYIEGSWR